MRIIRAYAVIVLTALSITAIAASIFIADENARKISLGQEYAVFVLNSDDEKRYKETVNPLPLLQKMKESAKKAASIAPPPISNVYWLIVNSERTENQK